jgi:ribosomal protein L16 Arg81 hydroxylase
MFSDEYVLKHRYAYIHTYIQDDQDIWRPMLWMSHPGVVAQTHYDTQHNLFAQLQGTKRFIIFDPSTELHTYPNIHRSFKQSQVHLERDSAGLGAPVREVFSEIGAAEGIAVTVHPGDLLYIPPYWQHRVESVSLSLSLSVVSPSLLEAALAEAYWEKVHPFIHLLVMYP